MKRLPLLLLIGCASPATPTPLPPVGAPPVPRAAVPRPPIPTPEVVLPELRVQRKMLESGLTLLVVKTDARLVSTQLVIRGGAVLPGLRVGEAELALSAWGEGALKGQAALLRKALGDGAFLGWSVERAHVSFSGLGRLRDLAPLLQAIAIAITRGRIETPSLDRARNRMVDASAANMRRKNYVGWRTLQRMVFGAGHPAIRPLVGSAQEIAPITVKGTRSAIRRLLCPQNAALVVAGPVDMSDVSLLAEQQLRKWKKCKRLAAPAEAPPIPSDAAPAVKMVAAPNRPQVLILGGTILPAGTSADAARAFAAILAGASSARLQRAMREAGVTYGASAWAEPWRDRQAIWLSAHVDAAQLQLALTKIREGFADMSHRPPAPSELARYDRQRKMKRLRRLSSTYGRSGLIAEQFLAGGVISSTLPKLSIRELRPAPVLQLVLVGDPQQIEPVVRSQRGAN